MFRTSGRMRQHVLFVSDLTRRISPKPSKDDTKLIDKAILAPVEGTRVAIHNHHVRDKQTQNHTQHS